MPQRPPTIVCEDGPLDEARRLSQGPRMDPELYHALKQNIQSLDNNATRVTLPEDTNPTSIKNRILRVAGGLLFWRSADEDLKQAEEVAQRLQSAQRRQTTRRRRRRHG
jgi:hypothetical protein